MERKDIARELIHIANTLVQAELIDEDTAESLQHAFMDFLKSLQIDYDLSAEVVKRLQDVLLKELKNLKN